MSILNPQAQADFLGGPAQGAQGAQGQGPTLDEIAAAIKASRAKQAEAESKASTHNTMVKQIGDVPPPKLHSPMSALATGIRAYAMKKHMKKGATAAEEAAQAAAAEEAATSAYEKKAAEQKLAEERAYDEKKFLFEQEARIKAEKEKEIRVNAENDRRDQRDFNQSQNDTLDERHFTELVGKYGNTPEGRLKAHEEMENTKSARARAVGGNPDATPQSVQNKEAQAIKDQQRADRTMKNLIRKFESEDGQRFFGLAADLKSFSGKAADYFGVDSPELEKFNAAKAQFDSDLYSYANALLKARSGAAVTQQEFERFKREFPIGKFRGPKEFEAMLRNYAKGIHEDLAFRMAQGGYERVGDMIVESPGAPPDSTMMMEIADRKLDVQDAMYQLEQDVQGLDPDSPEAIQMVKEWKRLQGEL